MSSSTMFGSAKRSNFGSRRVVFELDAANSTTSASVMPVVGSESENDDGDEGVVGSESDVGDVAGPPAPSRPPRQGGLKVYIIIASAAAAWMPHWCPPGFEKVAPPDGSFLVGAAVGEWNFQTEPAAEEASYMVHQALFGNHGLRCLHLRHHNASRGPAAGRSWHAACTHDYGRSSPRFI